METRRKSFSIACGVAILVTALLIGLIQQGEELGFVESQKPNPTVKSLPIGQEGQEGGVLRTRVRIREPKPAFQSFLNHINPDTNFDNPSDGYFRAFLKIREAEGLEANDSSSSEIRDAYVKAYSYYKGMVTKAPEWKVEMVRVRMGKTEDRLRELYLAQKDK